MRGRQGTIRRMSEAPHPAHERAADRELVTSRVIAAPRPRVYEAFADPALGPVTLPR